MTSDSGSREDPQESSTYGARLWSDVSHIAFSIIFALVTIFAAALLSSRNKEAPSNQFAQGNFHRLLGCVWETRTNSSGGQEEVFNWTQEGWSWIAPRTMKVGDSQVIKVNAAIIPNSLPLGGEQDRPTMETKSISQKVPIRISARGPFQWSTDSDQEAYPNDENEFEWSWLVTATEPVGDKLILIELPPNENNRGVNGTFAIKRSPEPVNANTLAIPITVEARDLWERRLTWFLAFIVFILGPGCFAAPWIRPVLRTLFPSKKRKPIGFGQQYTD